MPLINVLYQKGDPGQVGVLSTPLLLYHVEQLILGNIEVGIMKRWIKRGKKEEDQENLDPLGHRRSPRDEEEMVQEGSATRIGQSSMTIPKITTNFKDIDESGSQVGGSNLTLSTGAGAGGSSPSKEKYYSREMIDTPTTQVEVTVSPPDTPTNLHHYNNDDNSNESSDKVYYGEQQQHSYQDDNNRDFRKFDNELPHGYDDNDATNNTTGNTNKDNYSSDKSRNDNTKK